MTSKVSNQLQESWPSPTSAAALSKPSRTFYKLLRQLTSSCASCSSCSSQMSSIPCLLYRAGGYPHELWSMPKCAVLVLTCGTLAMARLWPSIVDYHHQGYERSLHDCTRAKTR